MGTRLCTDNIEVETALYLVDRSADRATLDPVKMGMVDPVVQVCVLPVRARGLDACRPPPVHACVSRGHATTPWGSRPHRL